MKKLKIVEQELHSLMAIECETNEWGENNFILDGDVIKKTPACDKDPLFINIIDNGNVVTFVHSSASDIEPNRDIERANIWTKIKK